MLIQDQSPGHKLEYIAKPDPLSIAEALIAFANSDGGTVVLGMSPGGVPISPLLDEEATDALHAALRLCRPPVLTEWQTQEIADGSVIVLQVPRSDQLHSLDDGRVLIRRGANNQAVGADEQSTGMMGRLSGDFELEEVSGAARDDLDEDVIDDYLERRQARSPRSQILPKDKLLKQIGAVTSAGVPTVSGLLLFGREPQLFMPHSRAVFVKFSDTQPRGPEGAFGYGRREELTGPLPRIIDRAWRVIWEEMDKQAVVKGLQRQEQTEYPQAAVREALVNAVAHRDYRLTGRSIELRMYLDRLEITSPGGLPAHITVDNIVEEHYSRNPRLVNGLFQWGYIEELGLGVDRMIEDMVNAGHMPPEFDAKPHRFTVVLYNTRDPERVVQSWEHTMNDRQIKAMEYLQRNGSITNREYRELCSHVGAETLRLDLADLVSKGVLLKIGDKRGTRYILK
jgi:ATP-dependent DNA helicase RecG